MSIITSFTHPAVYPFSQSQYMLCTLLWFWWLQHEDRSLLLKQFAHTETWKHAPEQQQSSGLGSSQRQWVQTRPIILKCELTFFNP